MSLKKKEQLGMPFGTASGRLKKNILFSLVKECNYDICYRCKEIIESAEELSIEHKIPWLDSENPVDLFFDLTNISFSHLNCNSSAARNPRKGIIQHGKAWGYRTGCRCSECKAWKSIENKKRDRRKISEIFIDMEKINQRKPTLAPS